MVIESLIGAWNRVRFSVAPHKKENKNPYFYVSYISIFGPSLGNSLDQVQFVDVET